MNTIKKFEELSEEEILELYTCIALSPLINPIAWMKLPSDKKVEVMKNYYNNVLYTGETKKEVDEDEVNFIPEEKEEQHEEQTDYMSLLKGKATRALEFAKGYVKEKNLDKKASDIRDELSLFGIGVLDKVSDVAITSANKLRDIANEESAKLIKRQEEKKLK